jgi:hypothetical protein
LLDSWWISTALNNKGYHPEHGKEYQSNQQFPFIQAGVVVHVN